MTNNNVPFTSTAKRNTKPLPSNGNNAIRQRSVARTFEETSWTFAIPLDISSDNDVCVNYDDAKRNDEFVQNVKNNQSRYDGKNDDNDGGGDCRITDNNIVIDDVNFSNTCSMNDKETFPCGNHSSINENHKDVDVDDNENNKETTNRDCSSTHSDTTCDETLLLPTVPQHIIESFHTNGFIVLNHPVLSKEIVNALNIQLEEILRGRYNTGRIPDKCPKKLNNEYYGSKHIPSQQKQKQKQQSLDQYQKSKKIQEPGPRLHDDDIEMMSDLEPKSKSLQSKGNAMLTKSEKDNENEDDNIISHNETNVTNEIKKDEIKKKIIPIAVVGPIGFSGNYNNVKVIQVINAQKCNTLYHQLATSTILGKVVYELSKWTGCTGVRLAQDQIWAKPPQSSPISYHRDTPYFMFTPNDVITVWIALDQMDNEIGPLHYIPKSHLWNNNQTNGIASQFFQTKGGHDLISKAATSHKQKQKHDEQQNDDDNEFSSSEQQMSQEQIQQHDQEQPTQNSQQREDHEYQQQQRDQQYPNQNGIDSSDENSNNGSRNDVDQNGSSTTTIKASTTATVPLHDDDNIVSDGIDLTSSSSSYDIVSLAGLCCGGISIHHGKTWHGSPGNNSYTRPRRGIGLHYIPSNVQFTSAAQYSIQWKHYVEPTIYEFQQNNYHHDNNSNDIQSLEYVVSQIPLPIEDFPITYDTAYNK